MKLNIQDPSYKNSKYLHEELISECSNSVSGAGAYAFVSVDGIKLFLEDKFFVNFMENGYYELVVGLDSITNEKAINKLRKLKIKYNGHLTIKAYIHNKNGNLFHPKFSWFQKEEDGVLIIGSGNLTSSGLRHNLEAYNVSNFTNDDFSDVKKEWDDWIEHSKLFLFDIDETIVLERAKQNTRTTLDNYRVDDEKKGQNSELQRRLEEIYDGQPGKIKVTKNKSKVSISTTKQEVDQIYEDIPDETLYGNDIYWELKKSNVFLIAEIPKSGDRWNQANFSKDIFQNYFGATCGVNMGYRILLKNVDKSGKLLDTEIRPSVSVSSQNYRFELDAGKGIPYPTGQNRPIAIFSEVSCRNFIYELIMPGEFLYSSVAAILNKHEEKSDKMRRIIVPFKEISKEVPLLPILMRVEK